MKKSALLIFGKYPEKGKVKTRIATEVGEDFAYELSDACLADLIERIKGFDGCDFYFVADDNMQANLFKKRFSINSIILENSENTNISEKFNQAFSKIFSSGYENVCLIPTDLPFFSEEDLMNAFETLDNHNYVFGPENNGGVYLMGIKSPYKNIFARVRWSTENSLKDLIKNTNRKEVLFRLMDDLNTLDDVLKNAEAIIDDCPNMSNVLKKFLLIKPVMKTK